MKLKKMGLTMSEPNCGRISLLLLVEIQDKF